MRKSIINKLTDKLTYDNVKDILKNKVELVEKIDRFFEVLSLMKFDYEGNMILPKNLEIKEFVSDYENRKTYKLNINNTYLFVDDFEVFKNESNMLTFRFTNSFLCRSNYVHLDILSKCALFNLLKNDIHFTSLDWVTEFLYVISLIQAKKLNRTYKTVDEMYKDAEQIAEFVESLSESIWTINR